MSMPRSMRPVARYLAASRWPCSFSAQSTGSSQRLGLPPLPFAHGLSWKSESYPSKQKAGTMSSRKFSYWSSPQITTRSGLKSSSILRIARKSLPKRSPQRFAADNPSSLPSSAISSSGQLAGSLYRASTFGAVSVRLNTLVSPSLGRHNVGQWVTPRPSISAISVLLSVEDRGCTRTETDKRKKMSVVRWLVGRWARIDLVDDVVDPICRKPRNIDDAGFQRGAVNLVENGPKALFSRHIGLDLGANQKARSRRPYVTGAVADGLIRLVQMTAGDQGNRIPPHQLDQSSARLRLYRPISGIRLVGAVEKQRPMQKPGDLPI